MSGKNKHCSSTLDDFLKEEAVTRVIAWQIAEEMHTSRAQVDRILKAKGNITLETLHRAATFVGREFRLELVQRGINPATQ
jgi:plasmid maintenance system antidote protein VapI